MLYAAYVLVVVLVTGDEPNERVHAFPSRCSAGLQLLSLINKVLPIFMTFVDNGHGQYL